MDPSARALYRTPAARVAEHVGSSVPVRFARDPAVSASGRYVAWLGQADGAPAGTFDVYLTDRVAGLTEPITRGADGGSEAPCISADGRRVAFQSHASNLVPGDTNGARDVFVYDRVDRTIRRVSVAPGGVQAGGPSGEPALSGDGRWVAFTTGAGNLPGGLCLHDLETGETRALPGVGPGEAGSPALSGDGGVLAFERAGRVLRADLATGEIREVPCPPEGTWCGAPQLSADGSVMAFLAGTPSDGFRVGKTGLYVHEQGRVRRVGADLEGRPLDTVGGYALSGDGTTVAYLADGLQRSPVLQADLDGGLPRLVTAGPGGSQDYGESLHPSLSHDGRTVALATSCRNLGARPVRADSGLEPYRIFAVDSNNVRLEMERAAGGQEAAGTIRLEEHAVEVGAVRLPRRP